MLRKNERKAKFIWAFPYFLSIPSDDESEALEWSGVDQLLFLTLLRPEGMSLYDRSDDTLGG